MKVSHVFQRKVVYGLFLSVASLLLNSCGSSPGAHLLSTEGIKFNKALSATIRSSDKIEVIEHSHWDDFSNTSADRRNAPKYIYGRKSLSASGRANFASNVDSLSGIKRTYDHEGCLLVPHYTIQFYQAGKKSSSLELCFKCDDLQWKNGPDLTQSKDIIPALNTVIRSAGFNPSIDWKKRASDRYSVDQRKKIEKREKAKEVRSAGPPTAKSVPGKEGLLLFNPFTQNHVDVEGIPSGTKIRDPQDPEGRVFRVP